MREDRGFREVVQRAATDVELVTGGMGCHCWHSIQGLFLFCLFLFSDGMARYSEPVDNVATAVVYPCVCVCVWGGAHSFRMGTCRAVGDANGASLFLRAVPGAFFFSFFCVVA